MAHLTRRDFIARVGGAFAGVTIVPALASLAAAACSDSTSQNNVIVLDLGTDPGVLNYCYAFLQLEADFYARVTSNIFPGMLASERTSFLSFQNTTTAQRNDLQNTQTNGRIRDDLLFNMNSVNFSNRASVLANAQTITEAAANGYTTAASRAKSADTIAKINTIATSAVQRATTIRAMLGLSAFTASVVDPAAVLSALSAYYDETLNVRNA